MAHTVADLIDGRTFVESPRWHDGRIWFSELYRHSVWSALEDGSDLRLEATVPEQPSGLAWLPDGRLIVTSMRDRKLLRREHDGTLVVHADLSDHASGFVNEVVVDGQGRAYVGNFGFDLDNGAPMRSASIHRVDLDGTITEAATDLWFPNGCVLTDDGRFIVNETFGNRISSFELTDGGMLVNRTTWAEFGPLPTTDNLADAADAFVVQADGMCIDAEGALWIADLGSRTLMRLREGGEILDEIDPGMMPFSGVIGGSDGHTMFICAAPDFDVDDRKSTLLAKVLTAKVPVGA